MQSIRVTQPAELLATVPYILGFHPSDSLVLIGIRDKRLHFAVRAELAECRTHPQSSARHLAAVLVRQEVDGAVVIGYGTPEHVNEVTAAMRRAALDHGIPVVDVLRVTNGRFFSVDCPDADCCPPEGREFRPDTSFIAAEATLAGHVALPDRATLTRSIGAAEDPDGELSRATDRAESRLIAILEQIGGHEDLVVTSTQLLMTALDTHRRGQFLNEDDATWLSMVTLVTEVRDVACQLIETRPEKPHIALW
nr:DUF4192 domain-containing protein [Longispora sp. (in: high G+C Gram-positive bacteria)]